MSAAANERASLDAGERRRHAASVKRALAGVFAAALSIAGCARTHDPARAEADSCAAPVVGAPDATVEPATPSIALDAAIDLQAPWSPGGALCDLSQGLRLIVDTQGFGKRVPFATFDYVYGVFLAVDGRCHFYAQATSIGGIRQGTLSEQQASALVHDLALDDLGSLRSNRSGCADGWTTLITRAGASVSCRCDDCADAAVTAVVQAGEMWIDRLAQAGTAVQQPLEAVAYANPQVGHAGPVPLPPFEWPLVRPMRQTPGLIVRESEESLRGVLFVGKEADALRELRSKTATAQPLAGAVPVSECAMTYALHLRDSLPAELDTRLMASLTTAWAAEGVP